MVSNSSEKFRDATGKFQCCERCVRKVRGSFRGLSEGVKALEAFHGHAEEA